MDEKHIARILVVDDQENWRRALSSLLDQEGYNIETSGSFEDAAERIKEGEFDLVILDVRLVDEDTFNVQGLELLMIAKSNKITPITIILTGYPEKIRKGVLEEHNADAFVLKVPRRKAFDSKQFIALVKELLQKKTA